MKQQSVNPFTSALAQLKNAADQLTLHGGVKNISERIRLLEQPQRIINVSIPVTLDSGELKIFQGYRVQHNNFRGPYKGGIRFHPNVSLEEVQALSLWMAMKCAVADLPLGGSKGGIVVDPKNLSSGELERLSRGYAKAIADCIGPDIDVPAPDVNTNGVIMGWMVDEFIKVKKHESALVANENLDVSSVPSSKRPSPSSLRGSEATQNFVGSLRDPYHTLRSTFTGKLIKDGGSEGREEATGKGGLYVLQTILKKLNKQHTKGLTVAVQGFGNVGYNIAKFLFEAGFTVVAVSDSKGGVYVKSGINPELTLACKKKTGMLAGCYCSGSVCDVQKGKQITNEQLLELPVDILIPSALESVITKANAKKIKASLILEMANGPTTPEADTILFKRNIPVVPDILSNSGGVTVSCFEWEQNRKGAHWTKEEVDAKLKTKMEKATNEVWTIAKEYSINLRTAAFIVALQRILYVK